MHVSEFGRISVFEPWGSHPSNGTPPPWAVPLSPRTTSPPMANSLKYPLGSSNPSQKGSPYLEPSHIPPDSLLLSSDHPSSSTLPQNLENNQKTRILLPPTSYPAPRSSDPIPVPVSPRPPTYVTADPGSPQPNLPDFDSIMAQDSARRVLTDQDIDSIARRVVEMQRDQRS